VLPPTPSTNNGGGDLSLKDSQAQGLRSGHILPFRIKLTKGESSCLGYSTLESSHHPKIGWATHYRCFLAPVLDFMDIDR